MAASQSAFNHRGSSTGLTSFGERDAPAEGGVTELVLVSVGSGLGDDETVLSLTGRTLPPADASTTSATAATPIISTTATTEALRRLSCIPED
ncbi:hypothetical protein GCM10009744_63650 [Kribbella alba]|uniref:Uncharacterized protein n=1 Tax=Kribbella alba TaxID=190197 RepID=A0ABN2FX85_9ACTN